MPGDSVDDGDGWGLRQNISAGGAGEGSDRLSARWCLLSLTSAIFHSDHSLTSEMYLTVSRWAILYTYVECGTCICTAINIPQFKGRRGILVVTSVSISGCEWNSVLSQVPELPLGVFVSFSVKSFS